MNLTLSYSVCGNRNLWLSYDYLITGYTRCANGTWINKRGFYRKGFSLLWAFSTRNDFVLLWKCCCCCFFFCSLVVNKHSFLGQHFDCKIRFVLSVCEPENHLTASYWQHQIASSKQRVTLINSALKCIWSENAKRSGGGWLKSFKCRFKSVSLIILLEILSTREWKRKKYVKKKVYLTYQQSE